MKCPHCGKEIPNTIPASINCGIADDEIINKTPIYFGSPSITPPKPNCFNCDKHLTCNTIHNKDHYEKDAINCKDYKKGFNYRWMAYADT